MDFWPLPFSVGLNNLIRNLALWPSSKKCVGLKTFNLIPDPNLSCKMSTTKPINIVVSHTISNLSYKIIFCVFVEQKKWGKNKSVWFNSLLYLLYTVLPSACWRKNVFHLRHSKCLEWGLLIFLNIQIGCLGVWQNF